MSAIQTADKIQKKIEEFNQITDGLGTWIDEGIVEMVAVLNLLGFPTIQSCEGHFDHGDAAPWVMFAEPGQPDKQFNGEDAIYKKYSEKTGYAAEDIKTWKDAKAFEIYNEVYIEGEKNGLTDEFKAWEQKNDVISEKLQKLLSEYQLEDTQQKELDENTKISLSRGVGFVRLENGVIDEGLREKDTNAIVEAELEKHLELCRKEMGRFTEFLKTKL